MTNHRDQQFWYLKMKTILFPETRVDEKENDHMSCSPLSSRSLNSGSASPYYERNTEILWNQRTVFDVEKDLIMISPSSSHYYSAEEFFEEPSTNDVSSISLKDIHIVQDKSEQFGVKTLESIKMLAEDMKASLSELGKVLQNSQEFIKMVEEGIMDSVSELGKEIHALENSIRDLSQGTEKTEPVDNKETYVLQFTMRTENLLKENEDPPEIVKERLFKRILGIEDSKMPKIKSVLVLNSGFSEMLIVFPDSFSKEFILRQVNERTRQMQRAQICVHDWSSKEKKTRTLD